MQLPQQLGSIWQKLTAFQRLSLISLLFFLVILPVGIWLALSPTSPFSRASTPITAVSSPTPSSSIFGQALSLANDGINDTYVAVRQTDLLGSDRTNVDSANTFTIETWVKIPPPASGSTEVYELLTYKSPRPSYGDHLFRFYFSVNSNGNAYPSLFATIANPPPPNQDRVPQNYGELLVSGNPRTDGSYDPLPKQALQANQWNHVAVVGYSSEYSEANKTGTCNLKMYINGVLVDQIYKNYPDRPCRFEVRDGNELIIGKNRGSGDLNRYFTGEIDELRITRWNRYNQNFTPPSRPFFETSGANDGSTLLMQFNGDFRNVWGSVNGEIAGAHYQFISSLTPPPPSPSPTPPPSQTFRIGSGYSLVGLAISKAGTYQAEDFLKELNNAFVASQSNAGANPVRTIYSYDTANGRWTVHTLGSTTDNNFALGSGKGYFIRSLANGTSTLSGGGVANTLIVLRSGWSLISLLANSGYATAGDFLQTVKSRCSQANADMIVKWQGGRYVLHQVGSEANNFAVSPGEGYWVRNAGAYCDFLTPQ